jgi:hypothetical protein
MVRPLTGPVDLSRSPHRRAARTLVLCTLAAIAIAIAIGAALAVKHRRADSPLLSREFVRQHEEFSGTVEQALAAGVEPLKLVQEFMVPAMNEVGRRFECSE